MPNRSLHLTDQELRVVREIAAANGTSVNYVFRVAIRQLAGLPAAKLEIPQRETLETR